jgi:hypothetical protein
MVQINRDAQSRALRYRRVKIVGLTTPSRPILHTSTIPFRSRSTNAEEISLRGK